MTFRRTALVSGGIAMAVAAMLSTAVPAFALSADAQTIIKALSVKYPDLKPICSNRDKLKDAVTGAVVMLSAAKKISPDKAAAAAAGQEAGRYLYLHCPPA